MINRLTFLLIATFWVVMNVLLWRAEFGNKEVGTAVPIQNVWEKVLTAPDNSSLDIMHRGKKIGDCVWSPNVGQELATGKVSTYEYEPEGMVQELSNYTLELDGNLNLKTIKNNVRFELMLTLSTNKSWEEFKVRVSMRPHFWEVSARAADEKIDLLVYDESGLWEQNYTFDDLQNPEKLIEELGGPFALAIVSGFGLRSPQNSVAKASFDFKWEAHNDWMLFGHSKVRVYRLESKVLDRFKIFVYVSRVGEILWVHLPDDIVLSNHAFTHF
jgi:hypothetical protein